MNESRSAHVRPAQSTLLSVAVAMSFGLAAFHLARGIGDLLCRVAGKPIGFGGMWAAVITGALVALVVLLRREDAAAKAGLSGLGIAAVGGFVSALVAGGVVSLLFYPLPFYVWGTESGSELVVTIASLVLLLFVAVRRDSGSATRRVAVAAAAVLVASVAAQSALSALGPTGAVYAFGPLDAFKLRLFTQGCPAYVALFALGAGIAISHPWMMRGVDRRGVSIPPPPIEQADRAERQELN